MASRRARPPKWRGPRARPLRMGSSRSSFLFERTAMPRVVEPGAPVGLDIASRSAPAGLPDHDAPVYLLAMGRSPLREGRTYCADRAGYHTSRVPVVHLERCHRPVDVRHLHAPRRTAPVPDRPTLWALPPIRHAPRPIVPALLLGPQSVVNPRLPRHQSASFAGALGWDRPGSLVRDPIPTQVSESFSHRIRLSPDQHSSTRLHALLYTPRHIYMFVIRCGTASEVISVGCAICV